MLSTFQFVRLPGFFQRGAATAAQLDLSRERSNERSPTFGMVAQKYHDRMSLKRLVIFPVVIGLAVSMVSCRITEFRLRKTYSGGRVFSFA